MSNGIKRIGKGLFAIFMIKLSLVVGVLAFQACQTESTFDSELQEEAKKNFLATLQETNQRLQEIVISPSVTKGDIKGSDLMKENTDEITTFKMCLLLNQDDTTNPSNTGVIDPASVDTVGEVIILGNDGGNRPVVIDDTDANNVANDPVAFGFSMCFDIPEEPTVEALQPAVIEAKNYLYQFGFTDNEIADMLVTEEGTEIDLVPLVMIMANIEEHGSVAFNYLNVFIPTTNAQSVSDLSRCAIYAIGADIIWSLGSDPGKWKKKALRKAFGAVAKRLLGPIGVAIAVVSFGICVAEAALTDV